MDIGTSGVIICEISAASQQSMRVEWRIEPIMLHTNFCQLVSSPRFHLENAEWYLSLLVLGSTVFLRLTKYYSVNASHRVVYRLGIRDESGNMREFGHDDTHFTTNTCLFSFKSSLNNLQLLSEKNGALTFFCHFEVKKCDCILCMPSEDAIKNSGRNVSTQTTPCGGVERLLKDFKNLLITGEDSDVIIKVKDREFKVHKAVLRTRSSVLCSMLGHDMLEKNSKSIDIIDCEPDAFQHFLTFLYSGYINDLSNDNVFNLYYIGDKYNSEEIKIICIKFMKDNLSIQTFCQIVTVAMLHHEADLLGIATDFFARNMKEIIVTVQWQSFLKENPTAANELHIKAMDYYTLCK